MLILVIGATGAVGRPLVKALTTAGHQVLAGTRYPVDYTGPAEPITFDLDDPDIDGLDPRVASADAAYYLVHALDDPDFERIDRERADRFASLWGPSRRVVYLGGLGKPGTGSPHLRSRHELGEVLRRRCDTVELRASIVIGARSISFQLMARLGRLASCSLVPVLLPEAASSRTQPIAEGDLVRTLVAAVDLAPGSYDIGGPEIVTYGQLVERSARAQGRRLRVAPVLPVDPVWIGPASALAAGTDPWTTTALFAGMGSEAVVRPDHRPPGIEAATTDLDTAIATALAAI
ncbi:MAG: NAD(P)H-binding protein [Acidimicrobiales bacterium]